MGNSGIEVVNYSRDTGWSKPQMLFESQHTLSFPKIAVDHLSNAVVVWQSLAESNDTVIQASFFSKTQGWSQPINISPNDQVIKREPNVVIDKTRNLHISWLEGPVDQKIIKTITIILE